MEEDSIILGEKKLDGESSAKTNMAPVTVSVAIGLGSASTSAIVSTTRHPCKNRCRRGGEDDDDDEHQTSY